MRIVFSLFAAVSLLAASGKNQVTIEFKGGDGQHVRLDANDLQYKFNKLVSAESQARLSVCRPHSSLEEASSASGVPRYSHITGSVDYRRRAPLQLASLLTESRWLPRLTKKIPDSPHRDSMDPRGSR